MELAQLVENAGDAIVAAGTDGNIILWNAAAERIFGYTREEAMGRSLDLIIPERQRERHWTGYDAVMKTGITRYGSDVLRVPAMHKEGRRISIAFTVTLLLSADGKVEAIAAIVRDETRRWDEERALRDKVRQLESKH